MPFESLRVPRPFWLAMGWAMTLTIAACDQPPAPSAGPPAPATADTATAGTAAADGAAVPTAAPAPSTVAATSATATADGSPGAPPSPAASATASVAASAEAGTTERGAAKADAAYSAWLEASNPYRAGKPGTVRAVLVAGKGYKCNDKYPFKFKLDPAPAGLSYPESTARGIQYGPERSVLPIAIAPEAAGTYTVSGTFSLSVCTDAVCKIQREALSVSVRVEP